MEKSVERRRGLAVAELHTHAGTQFDAEVVAALCRVPDRGDVPAPAR